MLDERVRQAIEDPHERVGAIHDVTWKEVYEGKPPMLTLHMTWLEAQDDPAARPGVLGMNLSIPRELLPALVRQLRASGRSVSLGRRVPRVVPGAVTASASAERGWAGAQRDDGRTVA